MDKLKSSISIIYKIKANQLDELRSIFNILGLNGDERNGEMNYLDIIKKYTRVYKFTLKENILLDKESDKKIVLNSVFLGSFFKKSHDEYENNYIVFSFNIEGIDISEKSFDIKKSVSKWVSNFKDRYEELKEYFKENFKDKSNQLLDITNASLHIRYINDFDETKLVNLIGATQSDNIDNFKGLVSKHYTLFVNAKQNIALEYCHKNAPNTIKNVNIFLLAIAYRDYYKNKNNIIVEKASKINIEKVGRDNYYELLVFSTHISRNDAIYFFKNPTNVLDYETYYEKLKINEIHDEFINSLTNLVATIKLIHEWEDWKFKNKWEKIGYFVAIVGLSATIVSAWAAVMAIL